MKHALKQMQYRFAEIYETLSTCWLFTTTVLMQVQPRPSPSVNLNPGGLRPGVSYNHGIHGSMDSLNSTQSSNLSIGSTGTYSSTISIPLRSSLKKTKKKDNPSVHSGLSKKSVTIAIATEQTAV